MIQSDDPFDQTLHGQFALLALTLIAVIVFLSKTWRRAGEEGEEAEAETGLRTQARLWMILAVGAVFMSTSFSTYISMMIPRIQASTPAWRWLTVATVFTGMLIGLALDRVIKRARISSTRPLTWRATILAAFVLNFLFTSVMIILTTAYHGPQWVMENFNSLSFNPKGATRVENLPDTTRVVAEPRTEWTEVEAWDPEYRRVRLQASRETQVRLKTYYFPGWAALLDGKPAPVATDIDGVQVVTVPPGVHTLESYFGMTSARRTGAISFASALLIIFGLAGADYLASRRRRVEERAAVYPADLDIEAESPARKSLIGAHWKKIAAAGAAIAVLAVVIFNITTPSRKRDDSRGVAPTGDGSARREDADARLFIRGRDWIAAATDEKSLEELIARGSADLKSLFDSGKVIRVPNNTRVQVIQNVSAKTQVRIMEGDHTGKMAWVSERWVLN
jgi:hypothetical protein